jgi:hypothetical protein
MHEGDHTVAHAVAKLPGTSCLSKTLRGTLLREPGLPAVYDLKSGRQLK